MATEIERKFIVKGDFSKEVCDSQRIVQGYICSQPGRTVRIRIRGEKGFLTIKGPSDDKGLSRYEFEQEIPLPDAEQLLTLCEPGAIDKVRHLVRAGKPYLGGRCLPRSQRRPGYGRNRTGFRR